MIKDMDVNLEYCNPFDLVPRGIWMKIEHCGRYLYACDRLLALGCKKVLDAACADGYGTKMLSSVGIDAVGFDINASYLERARSGAATGSALFFEVDFDIDAFPLGDGAMDAVVCFETLEHVNCPNVLVEKMYKVLKKEGILLLSFPNVKYELFDENGNNKDLFHKHVFQKEEVFALLENNGFELMGQTMGQSICNVVYSNLSRCQKEGSLDEQEVNGLFYYDEKAIRKYARFLGYPNLYQVEDSYSFLIEAKKR